jgi:hypothetical protein
MKHKNLFIKVSFSLLMVNFVLAGIVSLNYFNSQKQAQQMLRNQDQQVQGVTNIPVFDRNYIMSDFTFSSTRAFPSEQSVQAYLERMNSPLKNYTDGGRRASYWIYTAARGITSSKWNVRPQINPGVIIAYLEKEQSLISLSNYNTVTDSQRRIATAMGYGCPDGASCNPAYIGFANQVTWAAYQLQYNFNLASSSSTDSYRVNRTITTLDNYDVFLTNAATAAQYRYTPHVYWGNYNLWKIITANGWGVSSTTYSYSDIDGVNLPNRRTPSTAVTTTNITPAQVGPILNQDIPIGTSGENIKLLQQFLRQEKLFTYPFITGYYGSITQTAHNQYKAANASTPSTTSTSTQTQTCQQLYARSWSIGQQSEDVKRLQQCLKEANLFAWPTITGYFGSVTNQGLQTIRARQTTSDVGISPAPSTTRRPLSRSGGDIVYTIAGQTVASGLNLRNQPCGSVIGTIDWGREGQKIEGPVTRNCLGSDLQWYNVSFSNGKSGWVSNNYLDSKPELILKSKSVVTKNPGENINFVNIRDQACGNKTSDISWNSRGSIIGGPVVKACWGKGYTWYQVRFDNGRSGWVASNYLD